MKIAGTVYQDCNPSTRVTIALARHPVGDRLWCIGCTLSPTHEVFIHPDSMISHLKRHAEQRER